MTFVALVGVMMMSQVSSAASNPNNEPIRSEHTGVALSYEATKNISCGDVQWQVDWKSGPERGQLTGNVTVLLKGKSTAISGAQAEIFDKFDTIDNVSATCNKGVNGAPTRSTLLVLGNTDGSRKGLVQLNVDPNGKPAWTFSPVE